VFSGVVDYKVDYNWSVYCVGILVVIDDMGLALQADCEYGLEAAMLLVSASCVLATESLEPISSLAHVFH
jgi:hypothetical protein